MARRLYCFSKVVAVDFSLKSMMSQSWRFDRVSSTRHDLLHVEQVLNSIRELSVIAKV